MGLALYRLEVILNNILLIDSLFVIIGTFISQNKTALIAHFAGGGLVFVGSNLAISKIIDSMNITLIYL
jgi:hypothetical protein